MTEKFHAPSIAQHIKKYIYIKSSSLKDIIICDLDFVYEK